MLIKFNVKFHKDVFDYLYNRNILHEQTFANIQYYDYAQNLKFQTVFISANIKNQSTKLLFSPV